MSDDRPTAHQTVDGEAKFRAIFDSSVSSICINEIIYQNGVAVDYRILDVNPSYEKIFGIDRSRAIGVYASVLYGEGKAPFLDIFSKVAETGVPVMFEAYFAPIDRHIQITCSSPSKGIFSNSVNDISERVSIEKQLRENESKYRLLVENSSEGIAVVHSGKFQFVNRKLVMMTGHSEQELMAISFLELIHPDDRNIVMTNYQKRIDGDLSVPPRYRFRVNEKYKNIKWVELSSVKINWEGLPATLNFVTDVTEQKEAEETLRESEDRFRALAEHSNTAICIVNED